MTLSPVTILLKIYPHAMPRYLSLPNWNRFFFLPRLLHRKRHKEGELKSQITLSKYPGSVEINCGLQGFLIKHSVIYNSGTVLQPGDCPS